MTEGKIKMAIRTEIKIIKLKASKEKRINVFTEIKVCLDFMYMSELNDAFAMSEALYSLYYPGVHSIYMHIIYNVQYAE